MEAVKHATAGTGGIGEMIEEITTGGKPAPRTATTATAATAGTGAEAARKGEDGEAEAPRPCPSWPRRPP